MGEKAFRINASWDAEAGVWIATSEDIQGLCAQADTFDELCEVVTELAPELLVANGQLDASKPGDIPLDFLAHRQTCAQVGHG
jgi:predicted RNase H-like HicB family nuclease